MINQECVNLKKNSIFKDEESRLDAIERINSVYEDNQTLKEKVQQLLTITANIISDVGIRLDSMDYDMSKVMQERKL